MKTIFNRLRRWFSYFLASQVHRKKRSKADDVLRTIRGIKGEFREPKVLKYLRKIDPFVFEELLLTVLEEQGHEVKRNSRYTGDGGIDGVFFKNGQTVYVQAKRYSDHIKLEDVSQFVDKVHKNGVRGLFIHTGKTRESAWELVRASSVDIVSGNSLVMMVTQK